MGRLLHIVATSGLLAGCDRAPVFAPTPFSAGGASESGVAADSSVPVTGQCSPAVYEATYAASFGQLDDGELSSCAHCHRAEVDLLMWAQDTACQTTACYVEVGWFDLDSPLDSKMIDLVQQAEMAGEVNTEPWRYRPGVELDKAWREYQLLTQWVDYAADCHAQACPTYDQPCGASLEYGRCTEDLLVERFAEQVQPWLESSGCADCHSETGVLADDQPAATRYLTTDDLAAARLTMLSVLQQGLVDPAAPGDSRLLAKPLAEGASVETPFGTATGVVHSGGDIFVPEDGAVSGDAWANLVDWVGFHHACLTND